MTFYERILIPINDLMDVAAGRPHDENQLWREVRGLADDLNTALPHCEVSIVHVNTEDYLALVPESPPDDGTQTPLG